MKRGAFRTTLEFRFKKVLIALAFLAPTSRAMTGWAQTVRSQFPFYNFAPTPPMGWNSRFAELC